MKMFALYLVCVACDVGMGFKYNLEGRVYMRNKLVKLSIECNTVYIHTCIHTYLHTQIEPHMLKVPRLSRKRPSASMGPPSPPSFRSL